MDQSISFLAEPGTVSIHLEEITVNTKSLFPMSLQVYFSLQVSFSFSLCVLGNDLTVLPANYSVDNVRILREKTNSKQVTANRQQGA